MEDNHKLLIKIYVKNFDFKFQYLLIFIWIIHNSHLFNSLIHNLN